MKEFLASSNSNSQGASGIYGLKRSALVPIQQLQIHLETEVMRVQCIKLNVENTTQYLTVHVSATGGLVRTQAKPVFIQ